MNDFDYDVYLKKQLAKNASRRVSGRLSKRCSLSSDRLTAAEWRERCGPVTSYRIGVPISWAEFRSYPEDIQKQYLQDLRTRFGATTGPLARMFGVACVTLNTFYREHPDLRGQGVARRGTKAERAAFAAWLERADAGEVTGREVLAKEPEVREREKAPQIVSGIPGACTEGRLKFRGTPAVIGAELYRMLAAGTYEMEIGFCLKDEPELEDDVAETEPEG